MTNVYEYVNEANDSLTKVYQEFKILRTLEI